MSYRVLVCVLLLGCGLGAAHSGPPAERPPSPSLRSDARLERPVSLSRKQIYLGELLDEISEATGARIEVAGRMEPAGGFQLAINVRDRPAREVMEGVRRLYDVPPEKWFWEKSERHGKVGYSLNCTHSPGIWGNLRRAFAEEYMLQECRKLTAFLSLPPGERATAAKDDPFLQAVNRQFVRSGGFHSFVSGLSESQLRAVIRGKVLDLPLTQLSQFQRDFVRSEFALANLSDKFDSLEKVRLVGGDEARPGVFLDLGRPGAHGVIGSFALDQAMNSRDANLEKNWIAKGETGGPPAKGVNSPQVLFDRNPTLTTEPMLPRLAEALRNPGKELQCKRWSTFALIRPKDWQLYHQEEAAPWPLIRDLRRVSASNNGYLRPEDWLRLARLEREQLEALGEEFPDAYKVRNSLNTLSLAADLPETAARRLDSEEGLGWQELPQASRLKLVQSFGEEKARNARLIVAWDEKVSPPKVTLTQSPVTARTFTQSFDKHKPLAREKLF